MRVNINPKNKIYRFVRSKVRNTPWTCSLVLRFKSTTLTLPNNKTDYHVAAFPRCANTFTRNLGKKVFPELNCSTHIHTISTIKTALKHKVLTIAIVRDPLSCISSLCIKRKIQSDNTDYINLFIKDYIEYHEFIKNHIACIFVISFDDLTDNPSVFIKLIEQELKIKNNLSEEEISNIIHEFKVKDSEKPPLMGSMPTKERSVNKSKYKDQIKSQDLFMKAMTIYNEIMEHKI